MARRTLASPPFPSSPLHITDYSLPSNSRLPKFMIAAVAGFILCTAALYYICKWFFLRKCREASVAAEDDNSVAPTEENLQSIATKALAQRLRSKIAAAIPTVECSELAETRKSLETEACAVCLSDFNRSSNSKIKVLPKCNHAFHSTCIDLWISKQASCPVCRSSLFSLVFSPGSDSSTQQVACDDSHSSDDNV